MFEFNINNPNEYVPPDTLPKSTIGKGGLSAMADAAQGSPGAPKLLGGLQGERTQADLEDALFPRIRSMEQLDEARAARRGQLSGLQEAIRMPEDELDGFDYIVKGMMENDRGYDPRAGFRKGVAAALDAKKGKSKQKREAEILASKAGLDFEKAEGENDDQLETTALGNLRHLAKPVLARSSGSGGSGSGNRFRWVPGTGYVDTQQLDAAGTPKVVFGDPRLAVQVRQVARKSAEKEVESNLHRITFQTSEEREQYIEARASEIADEVLGGATPQAPGATPAARPSSTPAAPTGKAGKPTNVPGWRSPIEGGRYEILTTELEDAKKKGNKQDIAALEREIAALPDDEKIPGKAPVYPLETPDVQAGKTKTAEKLAESQVEYATKLRNDAETGMKVISAVNELKQLKFDPGYFAKWKQKGGNLLEALGSNGPLARAAAQSGNAEAILQGLSNARISLEKGVQTKDDEARFKAEIAKITDPRQGYEYMLKYMTELANKNIEQYNTVEGYRKAKGNYDGADQAWQKRTSQYGGLVKRYQGGFIGRSEFVDSIVNNPSNKSAYKGDEAALRERAEREWAALGGKK